MLKQVINDLITTIRTVSGFTNPAVNVIRGEIGKVNTIGREGCLVMPEFEPPANFMEGEDGTTPVKQIKFTPHCFVIVSGRKDLLTAEDDVMSLSLKIIQKVHSTEFFVDMEGNSKYCKLELTDMEWLDRSASLCVINLEFTLYLQV